VRDFRDPRREVVAPVIPTITPGAIAPITPEPA
jgi:hypothetical protein